ncbi:diphthine synthase [Aspergillus terreus NIH2624]|uniref:diphthine methyl ester synthase n=1 Tax=Aspergillus terreus (strain NIH 2624 / FGSC A1156) TaxID=341663 RepID=Q0D0D2_ASPTN|nr:diphthine synthase [Aspergillus terreus NIH2624]EAU39248.1 diphthine synthase [Aspergillus terreus NIH2624]
MLYLVGLGLADETDITVKGLEVVKKAERVYLEAYTSILLVDKEKLEAFYGRPVIVADRELVESGSDDILAGADKTDVAFLVVGDPFGATTHTDLVLRARELGIESKVIPNASIMSGIGCTGLQLYNFGQTVSMVFFTENWKPSSYYDRVKENVQLGLHTLVLVDIKVKEPSLESMARGRIVYEPPAFHDRRTMHEPDARDRGGTQGGCLRTRQPCRWRCEGRSCRPEARRWNVEGIVGS